MTEDGREHEQIHGGNVRSVVSQKGLPPVCTENSNPDVVMVKPAEDGL
jgi:hypothetical protein